MENIEYDIIDKDPPLISLDNPFSETIRNKINQRKEYIKENTTSVLNPLYIFIDGYHLYKETKNDLKIWLNHLQKIHEISPEIDDLTLPIVVDGDFQAGEERYNAWQTMQDSKGFAEFIESKWENNPDNNFKYDQKKHINYTKLFLSKTEEEINKHIVNEYIQLLKKENINEDNIFTPKKFNDISSRLFGFPIGQWHIKNLYFLGNDDKEPNDLIKELYKIKDTLNEFKNLKFAEKTEDGRILKFAEYIFPKNITNEQLILLSKLFEKLDVTKDLERIFKDTERKVLIEINPIFKVFKGSSDLENLIKLIKYNEKNENNQKIKDWHNKNLKELDYGKLYVSEEHTYSVNLKNINFFYNEIEKYFNLEIHEGFTKWNLKNKDGKLFWRPNEKGVDTKLNNALMKQLLTGEDSLVCVITNDTDFAPTFEEIMNNMESNDSSIKKLFFCSANKKSRTPKELKNHVNAMVFPKDKIKHDNVRSIWSPPLPNYSYLLEADSRNNLKRTLTNQLNKKMEQIKKIENEIKERSIKIDDHISRIEKAFLDLKAERVD